MTNYERIKNMSVDDIAKVLCEYECESCVCYMAAVACSSDDCFEGHKAWLEQEYIEEKI